MSEEMSGNYFTSKVLGGNELIPISPLFSDLSEKLKGGFKRGEFSGLLAIGNPRPLSQGLQDLFAGKEDVVITPNDTYQLFSGKSTYMWYLIASDPVLRDRYLNATHIRYDFESNLEDYEERLKAIFDNSGVTVIDSMSESINQPTELVISKEVGDAIENAFPTKKGKGSDLILSLIKRI